MLKLLVLFAHLLGTCLAIGVIVATDIRLLRRLADNRVRIAPPNAFVVRLIAVALTVLIGSGAALVALGLHDDPTYLSSNPKIQAKLLLVVLLTLNAVVLHRLTFPGLAQARRVPRWKLRDFLRVAVPVAASNCLWFYCAFLGIARPWNRTVSMGFVLGTAALLFSVTFFGVVSLLALAAQDRTEAAPGWIDVLKRRMGSMATALGI